MSVQGITPGPSPEARGLSRPTGDQQEADRAYLQQFDTFCEREYGSNLLIQTEPYSDEWLIQRVKLAHAAHAFVYSQAMPRAQAGTARLISHAEVARNLSDMYQTEEHPGIIRRSLQQQRYVIEGRVTFAKRFAAEYVEIELAAALFRAAAAAKDDITKLAARDLLGAIGKTLVDTRSQIGRTAARH